MKQLKYWLFNESAVAGIINESMLQSTEFALSSDFIQFLRFGEPAFSTQYIHSYVDEAGLVLSGSEISRKVLIFDLTQCEIATAPDEDLLFVLQKAFRSAIRIWNGYPLTSSERLMKDNNIVLFPFPYSKNSKNCYRLVFNVQNEDSSMSNRGVDSAVIAFKYGTEGASRGPSEPEKKNVKAANQFYRSKTTEIRESFFAKQDILPSEETVALHQINVQHEVDDKGFKYMPYDKQLQQLTISQKAVVEHPDLSAPIRVEGPAGTGKTLALLLRAVRILQEAERENRNIRIAFFTHNNSTELMVQTQFEIVAGEKWCNPKNPQSIRFSTLQHFCAEYIHVDESKIVDSDAYEAKQNQLMLISDIYDQVLEKSYSTYRMHLSKDMVSYLETEEKSRIVVLLQHEFSVQIKGRALGSYDAYLTLPVLNNGLPISNDDDKSFVYQIFTKYQSDLEKLEVYDTDDVVLQAASLLNAPFWRRERSSKGFDYIFVDEMHMFNVNEQQVFHYLSKDSAQKKIPMCFALDYAQAIGDRGDVLKNYAEKVFSSTAVLKQEFKTVFRNSPQIAELCAAITAAGPDLFNLQDFINPYKNVNMSFTAREEELCTKPQMLMYESDNEMLASLKYHVDIILATCHCSLGDIAIIPFTEDLIDQERCAQIIERPVASFSGRNSFAYDEKDREKRRILMLSPENVNGLEFQGVILLGVDEGRVPQSDTIGVSVNYLRYSALNKLYLACSRAKYKVFILGTIPRGDSSCLQYALENGFVEKIEVSHT